MKSLTLAISALFLSVGAAIAADAPPEVAVKTCLKHADAYTDAKAGTATFDGNAEANVPWFGDKVGNFRLAINAGGMALTCTHTLKTYRQGGSVKEEF